MHDSKLNVDHTLSTGTHMLQNVSLSLTSQPGEISVSCDFINVSSLLPNGFLAIAYGNNVNLSYEIAMRPPGELNTEVTLSNLEVPENQYRISVFSIEQNGLPFDRSATIAKSVNG